MLGRTNTGGGGGGGLNFTVVNTVPSNPKEHTIFVNTSAKITSYVFSAKQPSTPAPGMVWILTGKSSSVEFNALKKNCLMLYPISAKQYISGAWMNVPAEIFLNGKWTPWWNGELYWRGEKNEIFTTNLVVDDNVSYTENDASITIRSKYFTGSARITLKEIDVTDYSTLCINITDVSRYYANNVGNATASISVLQNGVAIDTIQLADLKSTYKGLKKVDVSSVSDNIDIVFTLYTYAATSSVYVSVTFDEMYLDR